MHASPWALRLAFCSLVVAGSSVPGQTMKLVANLERGPAGPVEASVAQLLGTAGALTYFATRSAATGYELFATTGQPGVVQLVRDINPYGNSFFMDFVALGDSAFFWADDGEHGIEPWISDGTPSGTHLVKDIRVGALSARNSSGPIVALGPRVIFAAIDEANGFEPWSSDGTEAGTFMLADIGPGTASGWIRSLVTMRGNAYFVAQESTGTSLWRTDGTRAGTWPLITMPAPGPREPAQLVADEAGGQVFFVATTEATGREWWKTDGTRAGARLVADLVPGPGSPQLGDAIAAGGRLFFSATVGTQASTLWCAHGTATGARLVRDPTVGGPTNVGRLCAVGDCVIFSGTSPAAGAEPWLSDGTATGTYMLADLQAGAAGSEPGSFVRTDTGGVVFLTPWWPARAAVWHTDLTAAGTRIVVPFERLWDITLARHPVGGRTLIGGRRGNVAEILETDGTPTGTRSLVIPSVPPVDAGATYNGVGSLAGKGLFTVGGGGRPLDLWRSDGTEAGTERLAVLGTAAASTAVWPIGELPGTRLFTTSEASRLELWSTDGTGVGTRRLLAAGTECTHWGVSSARFHVFGASDSSNGVEPWVSDGTPLGTRILLDITRGVADTNLGPFATVDDRRVAFLTRGGRPVFGTLWFTDGTAAGTRAVHSWRMVGDYVEMLGAGGRAFLFEFDVARRSATLWVSDGTMGGTRIVASEVRPFGRTTTLAFFVDSGGVVWSADGTTGAIQRVHVPQSPSDRAAAGCELGNEYVFATRVWQTGTTRLWRTDGTEAGTRAFADVAPGFDRAEPLGRGRALLRMASRNGGGRVLFATDGTAAGTVHLGNVNGEVLVSAPTTEGLLVCHDDGVFGEELWVLPVGASAVAAGPDCAGPGRRARLTVDDPRLGSTIEVTGDGVAGPTLAALLGATPSLPQPRVGPCVLAGAEPHVLASFATGASTFRSAVHLPRLASLVGVQLALQAAWGPSDAPLGMDLTNVVLLTFGL